MICRNSTCMHSSLDVKRSLVAITVVLGFLGLGQWTVIAQENSGRSVIEGDCAANGIDPERCHCIMAEVVREHGIAATLIVTLQLSAQDEEAQALMSIVGEDKAMAASEAFDKIQNTTCSSAALTKESSSEASSGEAIAQPLVAADEAKATGNGSGTNACLRSRLYNGVPGRRLQPRPDCRMRRCRQFLKQSSASGSVRRQRHKSRLSTVRRSEQCADGPAPDSAGTGSSSGSKRQLCLRV